MRYLAPRQLQLHWTAGDQVPLGINCNCGCGAKSFWYNSVPVELLEHRYHVMHIHLPDKNVTNHLYLQVFLSEQGFPSLPGYILFFCFYFVIFHKDTQLVASSNFITAVDIVQSYTHGLFCQQVLTMVLVALVFNFKYHVPQPLYFCNTIVFVLRYRIFHQPYISC